MPIHIDHSSYRDGTLQWSESPHPHVPSVEPGDPTMLGDLATVSAQCALACMYCGSTGHRTKEHVIPKALGGKLIVYRGSCVDCQRKANSFETQMMREEMANVRFIKGLPSYSGHKRAASVSVTIEENDGGTRIIDVPVKEAPILLSFPVFGLPKMCSGSPDSGLELLGSATANFGADVDAFVRKHGSRTIRMGGNSYPVSFPRCIAKMAYGLAWMFRLERYATELHLLARAFFDEPESLGRFVGTEPEPYRSYPGVQHRVGGLRVIRHVLCMEIQIFAECGAPTYLVALGHIDDKALQPPLQPIGQR